MFVLALASYLRVLPAEAMMQLLCDVILVTVLFEMLQPSWRQTAEAVYQASMRIQKKMNQYDASDYHLQDR